MLLPLAGAVIAALVPARTATWSGFLITIVAALAACAVAVAVATSGPLRVVLGGWSVPVGIALRADGLSAVMVLLTAVVGVTVAVFATASTMSRWFWPLWLFLLAGMNAVYVAGDLFNTYVALELVTVGAVALVALNGGAALRPALRYLFVAMLGSFGFLMAVALLYARTGTLDIAQAGQRMPDGPVALVVLGLVTVSMALKTALFPMHGWLPPAHAGAASTVSPLMSALVIKASFVVLLRLWLELATTDGAQLLAQLVGVLGGLAVLWGGVLALRQTRLKHVIAYSTVAQIGYFFLIFPLMTPGLAAVDGEAVAAARHAWTGVLLIVVAHGLAKAAMFLVAGALLAGYHTDRLYDLRGSGTSQQMLAFAFGAAGVSLAGLPPTLGFVGKFETLWAGLGGGQWWYVAVLLGGGLLTVAYTARVLTYLLRRDSGPAPSVSPVPARMRWAALSLALLTVILGVRSIEIVELLDVGAAPVLSEAVTR